MNCGNKLKFPPHQQAARDDLLFGKVCISTHRDFSKSTFQRGEESMGSEQVRS